MKSKNLCIKIIEYIWSQNLEELSQLTRYKIAQKFEINQNYLSVKFKKDTQMTVLEFITLIKVRRAEELLRNRKDLTIKEISKLVGIEKCDHFRKKFKKVNGIKPYQFRRMNKPDILGSCICKKNKI